MAKRGYKLQEFAAHLSNVNCLRIGRKSCRVLVTGGEDHKVNLWAIGRPNCIMSLSGHTSPVESVTFDSSELLVVAGASNGTVKLWDLEEAKIVRTLAGHRSNCVSVDFHPFGEFFASGSLDTNLKIWDVRRKGSIHTYKGHTRGVSSIRFTPDGRWVVSGGEDNTVKLWDLTAGKLLHDFKCHKGKIRCIDFHPQEFLLATGSTDRTVKFWDLETFELIGSAGPEATGVCSMTFNSDGKTLFCGLHESLKVFSWEPIRCHDAVDVGWSRLADLNICEGKLLGCSLNQTCIAIWAADISQIGPYAVGGIPGTNGLMGPQFNLGENRSSLQSESSVNANMTLLIPPLDSVIKEKKSSLFINSAACSSPALKKNHVEKVRGTIRFQLTRPNVEATIILGNSPTTKQAKEFTKEAISADRTLPDTMPSMPTHIRKPSTVRGGSEAPFLDNQSGSLSCMNNDLDNKVDQNLISRHMAKDETTFAVEESHINIRNVAKNFERNLNFEPSSCYHHKNYYAEAQNCSKGLSCMERIKVKPGRTRSLVESWERRERCSSSEIPATATSSDSMREMDTSPSIVKGPIITAERELISAGNDEAFEYLMETHELFSSVLQCRLTKLRVVRQFWVRDDIKGAIDAMGKLSDNSVQADVINLLMEKVDIVKLDLCACLLPLLVGLLDSNTDRYIGNALEMLLKLVRIFGPVIHSTLSASSSIGVDLQAEKRMELCNQCFIHLQKVKQALPLVKKKGGFLAKLAQELNLALQDS